MISPRVWCARISPVAVPVSSNAQCEHQAPQWRYLCNCIWHQTPYTPDAQWELSVDSRSDSHQGTGDELSDDSGRLKKANKEDRKRDFTWFHDKQTSAVWRLPWTKHIKINKFKKQWTKHLSLSLSYTNLWKRWKTSYPWRNLELFGSAVQPYKEDKFEWLYTFSSVLLSSEIYVLTTANDS